jgi:hypothetical protein
MAVTAKLASETELKEAADGLIDEMVNGDDTHWQAYAERLAAEYAQGTKLGLFKRWSFNNRMLLHVQVAHRRASVKALYAGVSQWQTRGRSIRDGEKPYFIYGPPSYFTRTPRAAAAAAGQTGPTSPQGATQHGSVTLNQTTMPAATGTPTATTASAAAPVRMFRKPPLIEVFDWTQTVAQDPDYVEPDWSVPLAFGDFDTLHQLTLSSPVPVRFAELGSRNERGWLDATGITVDSSQPIGNQIWTLVHELAHDRLRHLDQLSCTITPDVSSPDDAALHALCEQEAALTQFFVMMALGLGEDVGNDITTAAGLYLKSWTKQDKDGNTITLEGHKGRRKLLRQRFDAAYSAAQAIVTGYLEAGSSVAAPAGTDAAEPLNSESGADDAAGPAPISAHHLAHVLQLV